ncbi:MAG: DUF4139 domain-containing protein [Polyangiaceae bacterium]
MLSRVRVALGAGLAALTCACGSATTTTLGSSPVLPLRTLRLYETGVGYFERSGALAGDRASLPVPAGHLDDALKTLVVLGPDGKTSVQGVEFGSSISRGMARALAGLPVDDDEPLGLQQLLVGLKGAGVEVHARGLTHTGRIVDVVQSSDDGVVVKEAAAATEAQGDAKARDKPRALTLLVLTDHGAIVRIPAADVDSVRPLDPGYATRLGSALDALSTRGAQSKRALSVLAHAGGPVTLGYVAETPVWRTTYRLVLDATGNEAVLQGWALLHNDTDEDWRGVRVELANGRPDSFLFPLAAPRYARRGLVTPDDQLATVPQLMGTTVDALYGDQLGDSYGAGGLGLSGVGEGGGGRGEGIGLGRLGTIGHGSGVGSSTLLDVGSLAAAAPAAGVEAGALFVYTLPGPVDLHAHDSALVPFAQQRVDASPIAWIDSAGSPARSAVRFVNSTSQTLPAGTIAFFADGGFAGEASLARVKPGERRFLTYGQDLDVELRAVDRRATEEPRRLVWREDGRYLEEHYIRTSDFTYAIENRSGRPRSVMLAMSLDRNATLTGPDAVDFDAATTRPLAVFAIEPRKSVERKAHAVEGLVRTTAFAALTAARLTEIAASGSLGAADRAAATEAAARLHQAEDDARAAAQAKVDLVEVEKDLQRLREHMKALSGEHPAGGANPFAVRVLAAEDRLTALRKKLDGLEIDGKARSDAAQAALAKLVVGPA